MTGIKYLIGKIVLFSFLLICQRPILNAQNTPFPIKPIDEKRVKEIGQMLPSQPAGYGDPCSKRDVWDQLLKSGKYDQFLKEMENFSFPPFSKEDYFSLSDGSASSSGRGLQMMRKRAKGLSQVTWAECLENKSRFTKQVEEGLRDILDQKSWVSPRIDYGFKNYNGIEYSVELTSSLYAHTIAQTLYLMGNKLSPGLRKDAVDALYKRVFNPLLHKIKTQNQAPENSFLIATNNWNHVCLAGVVGAALAVLEDKRERAVFISIGEYYSQNGLTGFGEDGYCTEGIGYFNYGVGHYILLRENIWQATGGKLDLFADPKVQKIAMYPSNLEIINGVYPAISDSHQGAKPDASIMTYLSRSLGLGLREYDSLTFEGKTDDNCNNVMMVFPNSSSLSKPQDVKKEKDQLIRSFFEQTGVLITRPATGSPCNMGVAFKGGNNSESHNHNDVGSFTIVLGDEIIVGDPGSIPYTANIFDSKYRYTYKTIGSYGHPVPLVAGKEQVHGSQAKANAVYVSFTQAKDELTLDIASAYDIPELKTLERKLEYNRTGKGNVTITDSFSFTSPCVFETAVITRAKCSKISNNILLLQGTKQKMKIIFTSLGNQLSIKTEEISEGGKPYTRIGIYVDKPLASGQIIVNYKPSK
jgi:hypothetical protein